ncbi:hypothetical protein JRO89_XS05G0261300 [Xanthoceras sorbifolium]|uniref:Disease resistance R13L4/SHOC-2-like LRR domain-containing protein n=1 Tax=Xanthoceras sorbifolium TaxID=99658 RepID=A0ABQ8I3D8_9ROSI|nr:hypothetical protein JRO89_XS05G0261300 [Xanthoceras sorbifolium]
MKHLRYLDLSSNYEIKKLPNSICKLQKLETLHFGECSELKKIPKGLSYLISLRKLILYTKQKRLPENVIECLNSLRALRISNCENLEYLCDDIGRLKALRTLEINECPSLLLLPCNIIYTSSLENLTFMKCEKLDLRIEMEKNDSHEDLNNTRIQPRTLFIFKLLNLKELPQWLLHANTLESLTILKCPNFITLPEPLQDLESLKALYIARCPKLTCLPADMHNLISLRELRIAGCPLLIERCKKDTGEDWPKIAHIPLIWLAGEEIKSTTRGSDASVEDKLVPCSMLASAAISHLLSATASPSQKMCSPELSDRPRRFKFFVRVVKISGFDNNKFCREHEEAEHLAALAATSMH